MMHTISGALRLLSPSSTPEVQLEAQEPEEVRQSEVPQGCPLCAGDNDRVPPLRGEARRRSSGYSHELREIRETRESSPRNKAAIISGAETAALTGFHSLNSDPLDVGFAGVKNIEDAPQK